MNRIYKVIVLNETVLVRAASRADAIRHIMHRSIDATVATQEDLVRLSSTGHVVVNTAKVDAQGGTQP